SFNSRLLKCIIVFFGRGGSFIRPFWLFSRRGGSGCGVGLEPLWPPALANILFEHCCRVSFHGRPQGPSPLIRTAPAPTRRQAQGMFPLIHTAPAPTRRQAQGMSPLLSPTPCGRSGVQPGPSRPHSV